jgi:uncharacterized protein (TIGR00369 family)
MTSKSTDTSHAGHAIDIGIPAGFRTLLGYRTAVWREGYGEIHLDVGPQHLNILNYVHGGVYATLLDAALGHAIGYGGTPGTRRPAVTVTLTTTYIAGAQSGLLIATGRLLHAEGRIATCTGEIRGRDGQLYVSGQGTFMYLSSAVKPAGQAPQPA